MSTYVHNVLFSCYYWKLQLKQCLGRAIKHYILNTTVARAPNQRGVHYNMT